MVLEEKSLCTQHIGFKCRMVLKLKIPPNAPIPTKRINIEMNAMNKSLILSKPILKYGSNYNIDYNHYPFVHLFSEYKDSRVIYIKSDF